MLTTWTLWILFFSLLFLDRTTQRSPIFFRIKREPPSSWWPGLCANYPKQGWAVRAMDILTLPQHPSLQSKAGMVDPERERELICTLCPPSSPSFWVGSGNESQGQTGGCLQPPHVKKNTQSTLAEPGASLVSACQTPEDASYVHFPSSQPNLVCYLPTPPRGKVLCQALVKVNRLKKKRDQKIIPK